MRRLSFPQLLPELNFVEDTFINVVLVHPEIPQNTGGIGRLCVSTQCRLHLIKPIGFSLEDKYLRRAGMDYWPHLELAIYEDFDDFLAKNPDGNKFFCSTKGKKSFWDCTFQRGDYLGVLHPV